MCSSGRSVVVTASASQYCAARGPRSWQVGRSTTTASRNDSRCGLQRAAERQVVDDGDRGDGVIPTCAGHGHEVADVETCGGVVRGELAGDGYDRGVGVDPLRGVGPPDERSDEVARTAADVECPAQPSGQRPQHPPVVEVVVAPRVGSVEPVNHLEGGHDHTCRLAQAQGPPGKPISNDRGSAVRPDPAAAGSAGHTSFTEIPEAERLSGGPQVSRGALAILSVRPVRFGFPLGCVMRYMIVVPLPWK
jgi:hypothetical protein